MGKKRKQKSSGSPISPNSQQKVPANPATKYDKVDIELVKNTQSDNSALVDLSVNSVTMGSKRTEPSEFEKTILDKIDTLATKQDLESMVKKVDIEPLSQDLSQLKIDYGRINTSLATTKTELLGKIEAVNKDFIDGIAEIRGDLATEMATVNHRFEQFSGRLNSLEQNQPKRKEFDTKFTVVITGLRPIPDEDPVQRAQEVIEQGMRISDAPVIRAKRFGYRPLDGAPGVLKAEFSSESHQKRVLDASKKLKDVSAYKKVYVNPSRDNLQMTNQRNMNKLLDSIPGAREKFYVNWNGDLVEKRDTWRGSGGFTTTRGGRGGFTGRGNYSNIGQRPPRETEDLIGATATGNGGRQDFDMEAEDFPALNDGNLAAGTRQGPLRWDATPRHAPPPGLGIPPLNVPPPPMPQHGRQINQGQQTQAIVPPNDPRARADLPTGTTNNNP